MSFDRPDWFDQAACKDHPDSDLWFAEHADGGSNLKAKRICAVCPVRVECLTAALDAGEDEGVWGGAGGDLLRWLKRARKAGGERWALALQAHLDTLDALAAGAEKPPPINRNGPGATHGTRPAYNRGCRCGACQWAAIEDVHKSRAKRRSA